MSEEHRYPERRSDIASLSAEIAAIHRENRRRDDVIADLASDVKELLALANRSKGGLWTGMALASLFGSILTWVATHFWGK